MFVQPKSAIRRSSRLCPRSVSETRKLTVKHWAVSFRFVLMAMLAIALVCTVGNAPISAQTCQNSTIVKCPGTSSALDLDLDGTGKAMRFFVPYTSQARTYFNDSGMLYTNGWMVISGTYHGTGDGYTIDPPSLDPAMLGIWSDIYGPAIQVRMPSVSPLLKDAYFFSGLDNLGRYTFSIENNGALQWGTSTRAAMDTTLYRDRTATLRTSGNFIVNGSFTAIGLKSAIVETVSYGNRKLYAMESPENWFEDFGSTKLTDGQMIVELDQIFAETVNTEVKYHVFLTPNGDCTLYVTQKKSRSFTVVLSNGEPDCSFDYRVVAKRKDYEEVRLERVDEAKQDTQGP